MSLPICLYTDGSAIRNPGPSGIGYVIVYHTEEEGKPPIPHELDGSQGFRLSTNNRMEIMACLYGLRRINELLDDGTIKDSYQINVTSDSEYLVKAINLNWITKWQQNQWMTSGFQGKKPRPVANQDLWEEFIGIQEDFRKRGVIITMTHIQGHSGHEYNERCDKMAVAASGDSSNYKIDTEYEKRNLSGAR